MHIAYTVWALLAASEATLASKQPWRSNATLDLKSATLITYVSMCILLIWCGPFTQPQRPLMPQNSLRGQIWPQFWNQWPRLPTYPCAYYFYGMNPLGSLRGHHSLQIASEVKSDLRFKVSDPNYLLIHVNITVSANGSTVPLELSLPLNFDQLPRLGRLPLYTYKFLIMKGKWSQFTCNRIRQLPDGEWPESASQTWHTLHFLSSSKTEKEMQKIKQEIEAHTFFSIDLIVGR